MRRVDHGTRTHTRSCKTHSLRANVAGEQSSDGTWCAQTPPLSHSSQKDQRAFMANSSPPPFPGAQRHAAAAIAATDDALRRLERTCSWIGEKSPHAEVARGQGEGEDISTGVFACLGYKEAVLRCRTAACQRVSGSACGEGFAFCRTLRISRRAQRRGKNMRTRVRKGQRGDSGGEGERGGGRGEEGRGERR